MRLEQLQYLKITANCHSMRKASELLHISQQNISKAICNLEEELGVQLFNRTTSGVFLTQEGEKVYLLACEVCDRTERISSMFHTPIQNSQYKKMKGSFSIVSVPGYSLFFYNTLLELRELCPKLSLELKEREALDVIDYVLQNKLECALTTLDNQFRLITNPNFWQQYDVFLLRNDYLKVLTTLASPLLQYQSISNKQLAQYPLIIYNTSNQHKPLIQQLLEQEGIKYKNLIFSDSQSIFNTAIIQQTAISLSSDLIFKSSIRRNIDELVLLPMFHKIPIVHVYIKKKELSVIGQLFDRLLLSSLQEFGLIPYKIVHP